MRQRAILIPNSGKDLRAVQLSEQDLEYVQTMTQGKARHALYLIQSILR
jgi:hypothetical protein